MHLSTTLYTAQRQSMVVSARLQQAIRLLQMNNSELHDFIEAEAEENPFVEPRTPAAPKPDLPSTSAKAADDWDRIAALPDERKPSLYAHLESAVERLRLAPRQARIAGAFLDALEPSGWLGQSVASVAAMAGVSEDEAEDVLKVLQDLEPAGIFARNLAECLRLQAAALGVLTPVLAAVLDNLPMVAQANMAGLARACGCAQDDLRDALRLLRSFDPKPGAQFEDDRTPIAPPDLIAQRTAEGWTVELNRSTLPGVVIRKGEAAPVGRAGSAETRRYVAERLAVARWLARAVAHRNETSLRVGAEILRRQQAFLDQGPAHLAPLTLREVADAIGVHESTVSRVVNGMMIDTPQGCFPLRHFFSAALAGRAGDQTESAGAARHRIRQMIRAEDPRHPLSDDEIARRISGEGIVLARRTVAKYREMLQIPTSSDRRRRAALEAQVH